MQGLESSMVECGRVHEFIKFMIDETNETFGRCWSGGQKITGFIRRFLEKSESVICNEEFLNGNNLIFYWNESFTKLCFFRSVHKRRIFQPMHNE